MQIQNHAHMVYIQTLNQNILVIILITKALHSLIKKTQQLFIFFQTHFLNQILICKVKSKIHSENNNNILTRNF